MKEKTLKKIKKLLAKEGVEEEKIDSIVAEIEATEENDDNLPPEEEGNPTPIGEEGDQVPLEVPSDEGAPIVNEADEVPPLPNDVLPPEDSPSDEPPLEVPPEVPADIPPEQPTPEVPLEVPPIPQVDPQQVQELVTKLEELQKANEGLLARVSSLEEALKNAGVIEGTQSVGDDRPYLSESKEDNVLDDVLRTLNNKNY